MTKAIEDINSITEDFSKLLDKFDRMLSKRKFDIREHREYETLSSTYDNLICSYRDIETVRDNLDRG